MLSAAPTTPVFNPSTPSASMSEPPSVLAPSALSHPDPDPFFVKTPPLVSPVLVSPVTVPASVFNETARHLASSPATNAAAHHQLLRPHLKSPSPSAFPSISSDRSQDKFLPCPIPYRDQPHRSSGEYHGNRHVFGFRHRQLHRRLSVQDDRYPYLFVTSPGSATSSVPCNLGVSSSCWQALVPCRHQGGNQEGTPQLHPQY